MKKINEFNIQQLNKEKKYIDYIYFSDLYIIEKTSTQKENITICEVILNNTLYIMYKTGNMMFFIPKDFKSFKNNFDDIIIYNSNKTKLSLSILSKHFNIVEYFNYEFYINDTDYVIGNKRFEYFYDNNNELEQEFKNSKESILAFINNIRSYNLLNRNYNISRAKRNQKETIVNNINSDSILETYLMFEKRFNKIDNNDSPILEILNNLDIEKIQTK